MVLVLPTPSVPLKPVNMTGSVCPYCFAPGVPAFARLKASHPRRMDPNLGTFPMLAIPSFHCQSKFYSKSLELSQILMLCLSEGATQYLLTTSTSAALIMNLPTPTFGLIYNILATNPANSKWNYLGAAASLAFQPTVRSRSLCSSQHSDRFGTTSAYGRWLGVRLYCCLSCYLSLQIIMIKKAMLYSLNKKTNMTKTAQ